MSLRATDRLPPSPVPSSFLDSAETVSGAFETLAERFGDFECLTLLDRHGHEERRSLRALWTRARRIRTELAGRGVEPGAFVLIILPTGAELVSAYLGVMLAGAIPGLVATPSNRIADARVYALRTSAMVENSETGLVYGDEEVARIFREHADVLPHAVTVLTPAEVSSSATPAPVVRARADDLATVQYSSGSTGAPNGVLLRHGAIMNNVRAIRDGLGLTTADVSVNWIPLYHDMGLIDAFLLPLLTGCPTVLIPTMDFMRQPSLWLWAIHRYRGAHAWAPNFAYALCAKRIPDVELEGLDLSSWRLAISAAEPILADTVCAFTERFARYGFRPEALTPVYGLAENVTAATAQPPAEAPRVETIDRALLATRQEAQPTGGAGLRSVSAGVALPHCTIEIRDDDESALPERHVGTIWLRTNCLFSGYHRNAEATAAALVDGWLNTGDRGYLAEGHLYFVSREKDLIVIGGEKYAPHDVETAINRVPGVREGCAVVQGVLNFERGTEELVAVIETKLTGERELERLRDEVRHEVMHDTGLALRHVILVPPGGVNKTTSGKLARRATLRRYADRIGAAPSVP